jgi:DNA processing protein
MPPRLYLAGDVSLLKAQLRVAIIGSRDASPDGLRRSARLARELVKRDVVVVSGLAKGIDRAAHESALAEGGRTIAVIGTPLGKAYPAENAGLQERIYRDHLLLSQFAAGHRTQKYDFPARNRTMAHISQASVIVEAGDTSGSLSQAAECVRLGRRLFILRSVVENTSLRWPERFIGKGGEILDSTDQILAAL